MKIAYYSLERIAVRTLLSLALIACTLPAGAAAQNSPTLDRKELKILLASAKTPADEHKLVSYYRAKAERLTIKSEEFAKQADLLATQPATIESKQGISCNCASHYRYFSKQYARDAKKAEILAAQHEQLERNYTARGPAEQK